MNDLKRPAPFVAQMNGVIKEAAHEKAPQPAIASALYNLRTRSRPKSEIQRVREAQRDLGRIIYEQHATMVQKMIDGMHGCPFVLKRDMRHHQDTLILPDRSEVSVRTVRRGGRGDVAWVTTAKFLDAADNMVVTMDEKQIVVEVR